jgi:hypothetical protein
MNGKIEIHKYRLQDKIDEKWNTVKLGYNKLGYNELLVEMKKKIDLVGLGHFVETISWL